MSGIAKQLGRQIDEVQSAKNRLDEARRLVGAQIHSNQKAQRLVKRLEECDGNIASLLSQAAECLGVLLSVSSQQPSSSSSSSSRVPALSDKDVQALALYEAKAENWFATLHDVQHALRSAVRRLQRAQQQPLATEVSMRTSGGMTSLKNAHLGSASHGHSLATSLPLSSEHLSPNSPADGRRHSSGSIGGASSSMKTDWQRSGRTSPLPTSQKKDSLLDAFVDTHADDDSVHTIDSKEDVEESKLSLSSLRQQERNWSKLAGALSTMAASQTSSPYDARQMEHDQKQHSTSDTRLLAAILNLNMEVVPETSITPIVPIAAPHPPSNPPAA